MSMVIALAVLIAAPVPDDDHPLSGGELADLCASPSELPSLVCATYLRGAMEGLISADDELTDGDMSFCLPGDGISVTEIRDGFLASIDEAPELRDESAGMVLLASLRLHYPCGTEEMPEDSGFEPLEWARREASPASAAG